MKVAIIGAGIAGNVLAHHLHRRHDITLFEAEAHIGGHTDTHDIALGGRHYAVDTGFIVFNHRTYPGFVRLLEQLGVPSRPCSMSFGVRADGAGRGDGIRGAGSDPAGRGFEYAAHSLNGVFAQRRNLVRPSFLRMLRDIVRFNRAGKLLLQAEDGSIALGEFLREQRLSGEFVDGYLVPMAAAIWSADPAGIMDMPALFLLRFFENHGLLTISQQPQWHTVSGGSARYVERLTAPFRARIRTQAPIEGVLRTAEGVLVKPAHADAEHFDRVFMACHADQALRLLRDARPLERRVLAAFKYQPNEATLHTDATMLPRSRRAWAAWNYRILPGRGGRACVTYNMNILQGLDTRATFCVSLNHDELIDPKRILLRREYAHPVFTQEAVAAQSLQSQINGHDRVYFAGAYWRFGFHEDGLVSALAALDHFRRDLEARPDEPSFDAQRALSRTA